MADTDTWTTRIQALLTKAESTEFPEEAEALVAKAQELMTRHAIDEATLAAAGQATTDTIGQHEVVIDAPYASAKASLLAAVAIANRCKVMSRKGTYGGVTYHLYGFESDVTAVEHLFASLLVQASRALIAAPVPAHDTPRRFRHAFMLTYSVRINQRLVAANAEATTAHEAETGQSTALVLVDRKRQVDEQYAAAYPNIRNSRKSYSSSAGARAGRTAADRATLGASVGAGARRALGA